ncbi:MULTISPECIES: hypothetical protein [unclassified Bradyrhizobium]|uniref:hypothetical protein n=1 Tax=unclassified Bradyrhizobium TaxID=2631580 RepID=UPI0028EA7CC4|nr:MULTISPECIES: hypothetical protein [unclassified Bradyrhizobium]
MSWFESRFPSQLDISATVICAGLDLAIARGWLWLHEGGTYVKLTEAGKDIHA